MRLAFISDTHLGFGSGTEREADAFDNLESAVRQALEAGCDAILLGGDVFDVRAPRAEHIFRLISILWAAKHARRGAEIERGVGKEIDRKKNSEGIPVISIHGNHERRARGMKLALQMIEEAGFLTHIHCNGVVLRKGDERVCVQGIGSVPDNYFSETVKEAGLAPEDCFSMLMIHQLVQPAIAIANIRLEDLPKGFDLYLCGDLHKRARLHYGSALFLVPGSTIPTSLDEEATRPVGFYMLDIDARARSIKDSFVEIENQRKVYFKEIKNPTREDADRYIQGVLQSRHEKKPVIRLRIVGKADFERDMADKYADRAIVTFKKELEEELARGVGIEEQRLSVQELGRQILQKNIQAAGLDRETFDSLLELMLEGEAEKGEKLLREKVKPI